MYSIFEYGGMIKDSVRMSAYIETLRRTVTPESIVLEIGTGTGIFALIACQLGARKVYAIEPNNAAIRVAQDIARVNGYGDKIEFIQSLSTEINLPEKVSIILSDLRGTLPLFQNHIPVIVDARKRFLSPNGVLIPQQDTLWACVVEAPEFYRDKYSSPWDDKPYGFEMKSARRFTTNTWHRYKVKPEELFVESQCWSTLDYNTREDPDVKGELNWTVARTGVAHGLSVWFDATLAEGIGFSNAPDQIGSVHGEAFFPFSFPVNLSEGDTVSVTLRADLVGNDYIWRWHTQIFAQDNPAQVKTNFKQSTFFGQPLSLKQLRKLAEGYEPKLNSEGKIVQLTLQLMSENKTLGDIAKQLTHELPQRFSSPQEALTYVGKISQKYSK